MHCGVEHGLMSFWHFESVKYCEQLHMKEFTTDEKVQTPFPEQLDKHEEMSYGLCRRSL